MTPAACDNLSNLQRPDVAETVKGTEGFRDSRRSVQKDLEDLEERNRK
jgi:hypothetical protein